MRVAFETALAILIFTAPVAAAATAPSSVRRLTAVTDAYAKPSPDGKRIVFQSNRSGTWQLYLADADGTNLRMIRQLDFAVASPSWSPDGTRVAFAGEPEGDSEIYVINVDGTDLRRLTTVPGDDAHPHWSPDGTRIMFNSSRTTPDRSAPWSKQWHEIFSMKPDGSDLRQHTQCRTVCTFGSYSPDMKRIVYRKVIDGPAFQWDFTRGERNSEVFVADVDGANERNLSNNAAFDGWPAWSPDGTRIAFSSNRAGPANVGQVYVMSSDGGAVTQRTDGVDSHVQPAWAFDGKSIFATETANAPDYEASGIVRVLLPEVP